MKRRSIYALLIIVTLAVNIIIGSCELVNFAVIAECFTELDKGQSQVGIGVFFVIIFLAVMTVPNAFLYMSYDRLKIKGKIFLLCAVIGIIAGASLFAFYQLVLE